ncbi:MAG: ATP-binding cassette domain-containing protein [Thermoproteus sp.]
MLRGVDLWKGFNGIMALRGVYISLYTGINCIKGPNGAGKTTLLKVLALLERPDRGSVVAFGEPIDASNWDRAGRLRGLVTYVPQTPEVFAVPVKSLLALCGRKKEALKWVEYFGLAGVLDKNAASLSPGMRRRLQLALAFTCVKRALLLDEPEAYLDGEGRDLLASALREAEGLVVGYVSHEGPLVPCNRTYIMENGIIINGE